jgi:VanZ family protein
MSGVARYWLPVLAYAALIYYGSAQSHPEEELPSFFSLFSDKVLHATEYAVLGALCFRAFRWGTRMVGGQQAFVLAVVTASLYGVSDELHQLFVPFRESSWQDWAADTIGASIGALLAFSLLPKTEAAPVLHLGEPPNPRSS